MLDLDPATVSHCRSSASRIADDVDVFVRGRTTVAIERTVARLLGVDGVDADGVPLPNVLVDQLVAAGGLASGIARPLCATVEQTGLSVADVAAGVADQTLRLVTPAADQEPAVRALGDRLAAAAMDRVLARRTERSERMAVSHTPRDPLLYVIVATGNIHEDAVQAATAAAGGADVVAVIRSTGQSLLDYVPFGPTTEGFGGTYATQANFAIMREALDRAGEAAGRYVLLCNYCSGLCMPEIAAMGAVERLDMMLNDALYGILFRDINPERTLIDQYFSRMINALAGVIINTGEDNYLTTDDAIEATHTVLASQFINEQLALRCGLPPAQIGLGHAMEMDPNVENGFLMELAQAQLVREVFPEHRLKFMPPTRHMTGDIFRGLLQDALFNLVGVWTRQGIQLLGMHTEAMHTPHMADRAIAIRSAQYVMNNARDIGDEVQFKRGGLIQRRAHDTLARTQTMLADIEERGLFSALERGVFAAVQRRRDGGRGRDGVVERAADYYNPIETALRDRLGLAA